MHKVMEKLRNYLAENPAFKQDFENSFKLAKAYHIPQFRQYRIDTFEDYINFYEYLLTWVPSETLDGRNVYFHICISYFVIDLPPVRAYQTPINPGSQPPWRWLSEWLIEWAQEIGKFCDTPESITPESLQSFYRTPAYHMQDYPVPPGGWNTFNEFFSRHIDPAVRPIDPNPQAITSPADSTFGGWWPINETAEVTIKSLPWGITTLLADSAYGETFAGGKFMHAFLNTSDYHRQHAPASGKVIEAKVIPGLCYLEVVPVPDDLNERKAGKPGFGMRRRIHPPAARDDIDAPDSAGYQFIQARGCVIIDTAGTENDIGLVAVLPIGMAMVSSILLSVKAGDVLKKGDEISYFHMGGSDIIVCFQKEGNIKITATLEQHNNVGVPIAHSA